MLKWLLRHKISKAEALERYLDHFTQNELDYLNNLLLQDLAADASQKAFSATTNLLTYIHTSRCLLKGDIEDTPAAIGRARASFRLRLAKDTYEMVPSDYVGSLRKITPYILATNDFDDRQADRLHLHYIMLNRIQRDGKDASYLSDLDDFGEGASWQSSWRT